MPYVPAVIVLMIMYMTSLVGLTSENQRAWYLEYIPICIGINALFLLLYHKNWNKKAAFFVLGSFSVGFGVEYLAQSTGLLYGPYQINTSIWGPELIGIPLTIGLYWFIITYSSASIISKFSIANKWTKTFLGTVLVCFLALFILPIGTLLNFWSFDNQASGEIPYLRYGLIWCVIGGFLQAVFHHFKIDSSNKIAVYVYGGFLVLFIGLWMFLKT